MTKKNERRRRIGVAATLLVAAVACLGAREAEAQGWRARQYQIARQRQAEAELAARIAQLNALVAQEQAARAAAAAARRPRALRPGEIPVNVPVNMPMYGPLTPGQRIMNDTMVGWIGGTGRRLCEARRAPRPYNVYRPIQRESQVNDGWVATTTGPRLHLCY